LMIYSLLDQSEDTVQNAYATLGIMKTLIWVGITIGGTLGGWLGAVADHGNWLGGWSILGTLIGSLAGVWASYKIGQNYL